MIAETNLQMTAMAKEEARLRLKREANEARAKRFLDARSRVMGVDVAALDAQVAERRQMKDDANEAARMERLRCLEIDRVMEAAAEEERQMRYYQFQELKSSWNNALTEKETIRDDTPDIDYSKIGLASMSKLKGEDQNRNARLKAQKEQMRQWVQEMKDEKEYRKTKDREEEAQYADFIKAMDEVREMNEKEEEEMRRSIRMTALLENQEMARRRAEQAAYEKHLKKTGQEPNSLPLPEEDSALAMDQYGKITRKDMFKGFTPAQRRKFLQENEELVQIKRDMKDHERRTDDDWALQQFLSQRAMEQARYEEDLLKEEEKRRHMEIIRLQQVEQMQAKQRRDREKFGTVGEGFFNNFGKSCR